MAKDLMDVLKIPDYRDKTADHPSTKWGDNTSNLIKHWSTLTYDQVVDWQVDSNRYGGGAVNHQSSQWLQTFLYNSSTQELQVCVNVSYNTLEPVQQGGMVYFYLILKEMFQMTTYFVTTLKSTFTTFRKEGLVQILNENVSIVTCQLEAIAVSLNEVGALPDEAQLDILEGLSICSCAPFKETFDFQGTEERIRHLHQHYGVGESTLDRIETILREASNLYNSLNTSNKWNVHHCRGQAHSCWNCGGKGDGVTMCKKPKDQKKIALE